MRGIPHHMMSFLHPAVDYTVHQFRDATLKLLEDIWARNKLPVLVGGTTYYVEAVLISDFLIDLAHWEDPGECAE